LGLTDGERLAIPRLDDVRRIPFRSHPCPVVWLVLAFSLAVASQLGGVEPVLVFIETACILVVTCTVVPGLIPLLFAQFLCLGNSPAFVMTPVRLSTGNALILCKALPVKPVSSFDIKAVLAALVTVYLAQSNASSAFSVSFRSPAMACIETRFLRAASTVEPIEEEQVAAADDVGGPGFLSGQRNTCVAVAEFGALSRLFV